MSHTHVIIVDDRDQELGTMEKLKAHQLGYLHRAFSVFIINEQGDMLLQQRALHKYHSGGLWTNACCSHPLPGETIAAAARRRLKEEMGIECPLHRLFAFTYRSELDNGLVEHEYDHILLGVYDGPIVPDPEEVLHYEYRPVATIAAQLQQSPELFTRWFALLFDRVVAQLRTDCFPVNPAH